jgi:hypothetical protein
MARRWQSEAARRAACWTIGIEIREQLVAQFMRKEGLRERPFLKDVVDDLIEELLDARLIWDALPLDRFAQSELINGRPEITISTRISEMPRVKDVRGIEFVAKIHEIVHVVLKHLEPPEPSLQSSLFPTVTNAPRLIVCRAAGPRQSSHPEWEYVAENAGLAGAIARADLLRTSAFRDFLRDAQVGGNLGGGAWHRLYETATAIGVNCTALIRYLEQGGICRVADDGRRRMVFADPRFTSEALWVEPTIPMLSVTS